MKVFLYLFILSSLTFSQTFGVDTSDQRKTLIKQSLLYANDYVDETTLEAKFSAMEASAFAFYRATAHLYYEDIADGVIPIPVEWENTANIKTWINGDFHSQNVGFFDNRDGEITFDLNDYDESYVAPFYYDTIRFITSIHLMRPFVDFNFTESEAEDVCFDVFMKKYQDALDEVDGSAVEEDIILDKAELDDGIVKDKIKDLEDRSVEARLEKWTIIENNLRIFDFSLEDLAPLSQDDTAELDGGWNSYLNAIESFVLSQNAHYFNIKDRAVRLHSGLGSLGVKKYYVLIEGPQTSQDDDIILEIKEGRVPIYLYSSLSQDWPTYSDQFFYDGYRAFIASKALLNKVDRHYGYLINNDNSYLVRRRSPYKDGFDADEFKKQSALENFVKWAARALAYAHARSDKDYSKNYVDYNFENGALTAIDQWPQAKSTMCALGKAYADQVKADYGLFMELRSEDEL